MELENYMNFYISFRIFTFWIFLWIHIPVLDPRLKLAYYASHEWESEWVEAAKSAVYTTYNETYTPLPGSVYREPNIVDVDTGIDDIDAALQQHIFSKRQKLMANREHEVDIYLKSEYPKGIDTLSWWHVSWDFNSNHI